MPASFKFPRNFRTPECFESIFKVISLFLLPLLLFTGCVHLPTATAEQQALASAPPKAGRAKIVVYRAPALHGAASVNSVFVDGRLLGTIGQATFMVSTLEPGDHTVTCGSQSTQFMAKAALTFYFETDTHFSLTANVEHAGEIKQVTREEAERVLPHCQQTISNF